MPRGDGTGPRGKGPGTGRGMGRKAGNPQGGMGIGTPRRRNVAGPFAAGPEGQCICPKCGHKMQHTTGLSCQETTCPKCGAMMTRDISNS